MARLIAEHTSTESKLTQRIEFLEGKLSKLVSFLSSSAFLFRYRTMARRQKSLHVTRSVDLV